VIFLLLRSSCLQTLVVDFWKILRKRVRDRGGIERGGLERGRHAGGVAAFATSGREIHEWVFAALEENEARFYAR